MDNLLRLTREDLIFSRKHLKVEDISYTDFKTPRKFFWEASKVVFTDNDGKSKVLKDRYAIENPDN